MYDFVFLVVNLAALVRSAYAASPKWEFYSFSAQPGALAYGRLDPIISPGVVSEHVHMFHGANALQATYDYDTIRRESTCSSVQVQQDLSNYWSPAIYWWDSHKNFTLMYAKFFVYYHSNTYSYNATNSSGTNTRVAFPPGLIMLAGNKTQRVTNPNDPNSVAAIFQCQRGNGTSSYSHDIRTFQLGQQNCDDLRATVDFPSCWDGIADNADRTHVVYPTRSPAGTLVCPASHPQAFMQLTYEWYWPTGQFSFDPSRQDNWVLSFGDTSGLGMHADFTNGWNVTLLQEAINTCDTFSEEIENCPAFSQWMGVQVPPCMATGLYPNENVGLDGQSLQQLPGCNPLWTDNSTKPTCNTPTVDPPIDIQWGPDLSEWNYYGCPMSANHNGLMLWAVQITGWHNMTASMCLDRCLAGNYSWAMLTWGYNCYCDNSIKNNVSTVTSPDYTCFVRCPGRYLQMCGGFGSAQLYYRCKGNDCQQNADFPPYTTDSISWHTTTAYTYYPPTSTTTATTIQVTTTSSAVHSSSPSSTSSKPSTSTSAKPSTSTSSKHFTSSNKPSASSTSSISSTKKPRSMTPTTITETVSKKHTTYVTTKTEEFK